MEQFISLSALGSVLRPEVLVLVIPAVVYLVIIGTIITIAFAFARSHRSKGGK